MGTMYRRERTTVNQDIDLAKLQSEQMDHDNDYHRDICALSHPDRLKHYALHFAKYVGRLSRSYPDEEVRVHHTEKTIADCFIVALAAANTLDVDLQTELDGNQVLTANYDQYTEEPEYLNVPETRKWLLMQLAEPMGHLSNAMESHDHMEPLPTLEMFNEGTVEIVRILLSGAENITVEIDTAVNNRWSEIEQNHTS